jgi:hypothetical protein
MVVERKRSAVQRLAYVCKSHLRGRCCFITILINMTHIKNFFNWLLCSEDGLTDYQVFILMREGGAV